MMLDLRRAETLPLLVQKNHSQSLVILPASLLPPVRRRPNFSIDPDQPIV